MKTENLGSVSANLMSCDDGAGNDWRPYYLLVIWSHAHLL